MNRVGCVFYGSSVKFLFTIFAEVVLDFFVFYFSNAMFDDIFV